MFGNILLYILGAASLAATVLYFFSEKKLGLLKLAGWLFLLTAFGQIFTSGFFLANIFAHNFQYTYIWEYSSKELPGYLLLASFYAGQQGSFMLWTLLFAIIGLFLRPYARRHNYEQLTMGFYSLIMFFLFLLLITKSPFERIWETYAAMGAEVGITPENGRGLNPVLENIWINIHPPILFIGYAALAVPFVFALAGMIKRDYQKWVEISYSWLLVATAVLGLGIILGGFWAYETLGWGGFWGWDPVENSSLLPWLVSVALVHTMLVQKRTGGLVKTNIILTIIAFLLVLYATFLTRSGILGDTSVHSFTDPGGTVYALLELFLILFAAIGLVIFFFRVSDMKSEKTEFELRSKEFWITLGSILLLLTACIVFIGTSWPIFSDFFGRGKVAIDTAFYNKMNLPLIILLLVTNAFALYLKWKSSSTSKLINIILYLVFSLIAFVIITTIAEFVISSKFLTTSSYNLIIHEINIIILWLTSFISLLANLAIAYKKIKMSWRNVGGMLSHIGLALLMLGILASGNYSTSKFISLKLGETQAALGYDFTFTGKTQIEKQKPDRHKFEYLIKITRGGSSFVVKPIVYWSSFNQWQSPFLEPSIQIQALNDIYVSPKSVDIVSDVSSLGLLKGESSVVPIDSSVSIELVSFDMSTAETVDYDGGILLGAVVKFTKAASEIFDTVQTIYSPQKTASIPQWKTVQGTNIEVSFQRFITNQNKMSLSQAIFAFRFAGDKQADPQELFTFEVSKKPMMNIVWLGFCAIIAGFVVSIIKYSKKKADK